MEQYGPELIPHLPWERPSDIESELVKVWQEVHLDQRQAHPLDDRLLAALATRMAVDARFGALGLRIGARAHAIVLPLAQRLEPGNFRGKARCLGLTALYWGLQGWILPDVFQRACDAGLLPQASVPDFSVLANQEGADSSDPLLFLRALAEVGVALILDSEQGGELARKPAK